MRITLKQLKQLNACQDGIDWFKKQKNKEAKSILRMCLKDNHFDYANWFVTQLFSKPQAVMYAIFNAEQCINNFEHVFPNDARLRNAIEAAKRWLESPADENRSAAYDAKSAAWSAESAARYAAWSAESAAWSAAYAAQAAAYAARSAWTTESAEFAALSAWSAVRSAWATESAKFTKSAAIEKAIQILGL
jgi:hypothetical protein